MPSLEAFKKQAKQILRWHREREYTVAEQIRCVLPRFKHLSDREIFAARFKLADAQELVARRNGFESWPALKTGLAPMPKAPKEPRAKPILVRAEPQLFVADIDASCDFYTQKLGFEIAFRYGAPVFYGQVTRDGAQINLRRVDRAVIDQALVIRQQLLSASLTVSTADGIKQLFLEFQSACVPFFQTLKKQPWGARNFIIKDPDGNLLLFAGPDD